MLQPHLAPKWSLALLLPILAQVIASSASAQLFDPHETRTPIVPRPIPVATTFLNVVDYGAIGDGSKDDTQAFQEAIAAATRPGQPPVGDTILVPAGDYLISDTLVIEEVRGLRLMGAGPGATRLLWAPSSTAGSVLEGGSGKAMILLSDAERSELCDFSIQVLGRLPLPVAIQMESRGPGGTRSRHNHVRNVWIDGGAGGVERGIRMAVGPAGDRRNDHHSFDRVTVTNYLDAAYSIEHRSSRGHLFQSCRFEGKGRGLVGLASDRGDCVDSSGTHCGGSFRWLAGGGGGNVASDFSLGDSADTVIISGGIFEGSSRFLHSGGPSGNEWPVIVEGNEWLDDGMGTHESAPWPYPENNRAVFFQFRGPLIMRGNRLGVSPNLEFGPAEAKPLEIIWNPGGNYGEFLFEGNYVATSKDNPFMGATASGSSTGIYPTWQRANLVEADDYGPNAQRMGIHPTHLSGSASPSVSWLHTSQDLFTVSGGNPIVDLKHGIVGKEVRIRALGERTFVHGDQLRLAGGVDYLMQAEEVLTLVQFAPGVWTETGRTAP